MSFAKLDSGIVNSTLWVQPDDVLRVWIWMLSQADADGVVRVAAPALAMNCMKSVDRIREILALLEAPDPDSRSENDDGRRICKVPGGWQLINYRAYRERVSATEKRENDRLRIAGKRAVARESSRDVDGCRNVSQPVAEVAQVEVEAEAEAELKAKANSPSGELSSPTGCAAANDANAVEGDLLDEGQQQEKPKRKPAGPPPCPHMAIVDLYHEVLPELTEVLEWGEERKKLLMARWRSAPERQDLEWWRKYFGEVRRSPWLMGEREGNDGRPFVCTLEWLIRPKNFAKVLEGNYLERGRR